MTSSSTKQQSAWKNHLPHLVLSHSDTWHPPKLDSSPSLPAPNSKESENGSATGYSVPGDDVTFIISGELPRGDHSLFLGDPDKCQVASLMTSRVLSSEISERIISPWRNISLYPPPSSSSSLTPSLYPPSPPRSPSISPSSSFSRTSTSSSSSSFPAASTSSSSSFPASFPSPFYFSYKDSFFSHKTDILFRFVCTTPMGSPISPLPSSQNPKSSNTVDTTQNSSLPDKPQDFHSPYNLGFLPQTMLENHSTINHSTISDGTHGSGTENCSTEKCEKCGTEKCDPQKCGSEKYGTEKCGTEKCEIEKSGTERCGTEKCGTGQCGTGKYGTQKSGTGKSGARRCGSSWAPVEVVDIGVRAASAGEVYLVRAVAAVRTGGIWRVVGIAEDDAMAPLLRGLRDVTAFLPGRMEALSQWLQMAHGESHPHEGMNEITAIKMVQQAHAMWQLQTRFLLRSAEGPSQVSPNNSAATWQPCSGQPEDDVSKLMSFFRPKKVGHPAAIASVAGPPNKAVSAVEVLTRRQRLKNRGERTEQTDVLNKEVISRRQISNNRTEKTEQIDVSRKEALKRCQKSNNRTEWTEPMTMLEKAKGVIRRMAGKMGKVSHGVSNLITRRHSVGKTPRLEKRHSLDERFVKDLKAEDTFVFGRDPFSGRRSVDSCFVVEREKLVAEQILIFGNESPSEIQALPENS